MIMPSCPIPAGVQGSLASLQEKVRSSDSQGGYTYTLSETLRTSGLLNAGASRETFQAGGTTPQSTHRFLTTWRPELNTAVNKDLTDSVLIVDPDGSDPRRFSITGASNPGDANRYVTLNLVEHGRDIE